MRDCVGAFEQKSFNLLLSRNNQFFSLFNLPAWETEEVGLSSRVSPWLKYHPNCHFCNFLDDSGLKRSSNLWILCLSNLSLFWRCFVCIVCPLSFMSDKRRGQPLSVNVQMSTPGQTVCSMLSQHFSLERAVCQPCQVLKSCLKYIYSTNKIKGFLWTSNC